MKKLFKKKSKSSSKKGKKYPWVKLPEQWKSHEEELKRVILSLSKSPKRFMIDIPDKFNFNYKKALKIAKIYLHFDPNLTNMLYYYVPKTFSEEMFWKKYFYNIRIIKLTKEIGNVENVLKETYLESSFAKEQKKIENEVKNDMKDVTKKVLILTDMLKRFLVNPEKFLTKEEEKFKSIDTSEKNKENENKKEVDKTDEKTKEIEKKDEKKKETEKTDEKKDEKTKETEKTDEKKDEKSVVEKTALEASGIFQGESQYFLEPSSQSITDLFRECVTLKKKLSFELTELLEPESPVLMHQIQAINYLFQQMLKEYTQFQGIITKDKKHLKIIKSITFTPKMLKAKLTPPSFTNDEQRKKIIMQVPVRFQRSNWVLLYSTVEHGISLFTLIERTRNKGPNIMMVKTRKNEIFGFYHGVSWKSSRKYYGSGESFVFSFKKNYFYIKPWSKTNQLFCLSNLDVVSIGGGLTGGPAIYIDSDLQSGSTSDCETFESKKLVEDGDFNIVTLEIWGFEKEKRFGLRKYQGKTKKLTDEEKKEKIINISQDNPSLPDVK